jgi:hypothetical protein
LSSLHIAEAFVILGIRRPVSAETWATEGIKAQSVERVFCPATHNPLAEMAASTRRDYHNPSVEDDDLIDPDDGKKADLIYSQADTTSSRALLAPHVAMLLTVC